MRKATVPTIISASVTKTMSGRDDPVVARPVVPATAKGENPVAVAEKLVFVASADRTWVD